MDSRSGTDIPQEIEDYIKESLDYTLGLPVSSKTLELKLQASEEGRRRLQDQYFLLHSRLKEKDETIERTRSEASMNAQALKKFVEENQKLAVECTSLLSQCSRWEKECSLYDQDREALMEFANEADERAKEAEARVLDANERAKDAEVLLLEAESKLKRLIGELVVYKNECEMHMISEERAMEELNALRGRISELEQLMYNGWGGSDGNHSDCNQSAPMNIDDQKQQSQHKIAYAPGDVSAHDMSLEEHLLDLLIASVIDKNGVAANARAFLEANIENDSCQRLLNMWDGLRPPTQSIIALAAEVNTLQNVREHLRINLTRAEEEVKVLFEENNILDEENKRMLRHHNRGRRHQGSGGKLTSSASSKGNKRKSSPNRCNSVERTIDFTAADSPRQPLSPLQHNSPNSRMHKK